MERVKTDLRDHVNSEAIVNHVHFMNQKQTRLKAKALERQVKALEKQLSPASDKLNISTTNMKSIPSLPT